MGNTQSEQQKHSAVAVIISDIHFNLNTVSIATQALEQAVKVANDLSVPLIIAGDLHDTKANIRAECVTALRRTLSKAAKPPICLVGNHCKVNEKSEENALGFIEDLVYLVAKPTTTNSWVLIPYQHDLTAFKAYLDTVPKGSTIIMHQGVHGSLSGEYIRDHTAVPKEWLKDYRVISGHYHTRQTIRTNPEPQRGYIGLLDYIGNPFTLSYGEVSDPPKGYQVLNDDGSLTFMPTNLRQHIIFDIPVSEIETYAAIIKPAPDDLVWIKIKGPSDVLAKLNKNSVAASLGLRQDFKLDLLPDGITTYVLSDKDRNLALPNELLDQLIDSIDTADSERKERLKTLWKSLLGG